MKNHRFNSILCSLALCATMASAARAATYYVSPNGDNSNNGQSISTSFQTIGRAISAMGGGDTVYLREGTYREAISLDAHQHSSSTADKPTRILAYGNETPVIKGSVKVEGWVQHQGAIWKKQGWTGKTQTVFVDFDINKEASPLRQIGTAQGLNDSFRSKTGTGVADMQPGTFFCDVTNQTLYVWLNGNSNPNNRVIEVGHLAQLVKHNIRGYDNTKHVLFRGLTFYHSNSSTLNQFQGAVGIPYNSLFEDCVVQWMDFGGIDLSSGSIVRNSDVSYNGGVGVQVRGNQGRWLVTGNRVNHNNWRRFATGHHAGGMKFIPDASGTVENNEVAHNRGSGIWFDYCRSGKSIVVRNNHVHGNYGQEYDAAIKIEAVYNAVVVNNVLVSNRGNGLLVFGSENIRVFHNTIVGNEGMGGIQLGGVPRDNLTMKNSVFANNLIANNHTTWDLSMQVGPSNLVSGNTSRNNLIHRHGNPLQLTTGGTYTAFSPMITDLPAWSQAWGTENGSISDAPYLSTNVATQWRPGSNSPAVGAGMSMAGEQMQITVPRPSGWAGTETELSTVNVADVDANGTPRAVPMTLGAYEPVAWTVSSPTPPAPMPAAVWVDDWLPKGAVPGMEQSWINDNPTQFWNWSIEGNLLTAPYPAPASGNVALELKGHATRPRVQYFQGAAPFVVGTNESLSVLVYLDPNDLPRQIAVQVKTQSRVNGSWPLTTSTWVNGGRYGENAISWLTSTPSRGGLPQAGKWVELRIPANEAGFAGQNLVGLALTVMDGRAVFDRVGRVANGAPSFFDTLPAPWLTQDIGNVGMAGSANESGGTYTVKGSGADIWGSSDAFRYVYQQVNGDVTVTARVASQQNTDPWAKAGVMIRETLNANSRNAAVVVTPSNGIRFHYRTSTGGTTTASSDLSPTVPHWVRVVRSGNSISAFRSPDGNSWTQVGSPTTVAMSSTVFVGLPVTSNNNSVLSQVTFTNVAVTLSSQGILANFDTANNWNQYPGVAGNGWTAAWATTHSGSRLTASDLVEVRSSSPLQGSGNYLFVQTRSSAGTTSVSSVGGVQRGYGNHAGVNTAGAHVLSFLFRADSLSTDNRILDLRGSDGTWDIRNQGSTNTWLLKAAPADIDTGMAITAGHVYHFVVSVNPQNRQYTVTIENLTAGTSYSTPAPMTWISNSTATSEIRARLGRWGGYGAFSQFSIDSIQIAP